MDAIPTELPDTSHPTRPDRSLWATVILQAMKDARSKKHGAEARKWLRGGECRTLCDYVGIEYGQLLRKVGEG